MDSHAYLGIATSQKCQKSVVAFSLPHVRHFIKSPPLAAGMQQHTHDNVLVDRTQAPVFIVTINNAKSMNCVNGITARALEAAFIEFEESTEVCSSRSTQIQFSLN